MTQNAYLFFHLNLNFSSIEEDEFFNVVKKCYDPLLDLVEEDRLPIGIELTGWTLQRIQLIRPDWVARFKFLLNQRACELIGSGYCQIIGPLAPYEVNNWNQKEGLRIYNEIVNIKPDIALVNEMVFSSSLVDLYYEHGYRGLAMDSENMKLALGNDDPHEIVLPNYAEGPKGATLPVLWTNSLLFQKVQHFAHGDISLDEYLSFMKKYTASESEAVCIYSNDAEVFDYRPGRFTTERPTHPEGEWQRVKKLLSNLASECDVKFVSPTEALLRANRGKTTFKLCSANYPIPVKKQAKYNLARWAVTGRNDLKINTLCHRILAVFIEREVTEQADWRDLCYLWSSDLRTHITSKKWQNALQVQKNLLNKYSIPNKFTIEQKLNKREVQISDNYVSEHGYSLKLENENVFVIISSSLKLKLNLRRGLSIEALSFKSHDMTPCIGKQGHGKFRDITLGADYYSGGIVMDLPTQRKRITDLERITPKIYILENRNLMLSVKINSSEGTISKTMTIEPNTEKVTLAFEFDNFNLIGSVRVPITLLNSFSQAQWVSCANGGETYENFRLSHDFDHTCSPSMFVSSNRGFGATTGQILICNDNRKINFNWNVRDAAVMPMMLRKTSGNQTLLRLLFSLQELDETIKEPLQLSPFKLNIESVI